MIQLGIIGLNPNPHRKIWLLKMIENTKQLSWFNDGITEKKTPKVKEV